MRYPVNQPFTVTTDFGVPDSNAKFAYHSGLDLGVPANRSVYAPASGQLKNIISSTGGNMVQIFDGRYYHRLMHNNSFSRSDGLVNEGEEVAKAGTTGLSFGVHVHWDIANKAIPTSFNDFISPLEYLKKEGNMPTLADRDMVDRLAHGFLNDSIEKNPGLNFYVGQPIDLVVNTFNESQERDGFLKSLQAKDVKIADLQLQLDTASKGSVLDQKTKDKIDQTSSDVSWIRALLNRIFK